MPNCFSLTRKSDPSAGPVSLQLIDDEMREHFGEEPDPKNWYLYWYETIGFSLACGKDWEWIRKNNEARVHIVKWLEENFIVDAWAEVRK